MIEVDFAISMLLLKLSESFQIWNYDFYGFWIVFFLSWV